MFLIYGHGPVQIVIFATDCIYWSYIYIFPCKFVQCNVIVLINFKRKYNTDVSFPDRQKISNNVLIYHFLNI